MSHLIETRDRQSALSQAWHGLTHVVDEVTRENSMPYEVTEVPVCYKVNKPNDQGLIEEVYIEDPEFKQLIATDDWMPVGNPYGDSYHPSDIGKFWELIKNGFGDTPYQVVSAGSLDNRSKIFASIKVSEDFRIQDRVFTEHISLVDSFDKTSSLWAFYSSTCIVCHNTMRAAMASGTTIGKAKHTAMLEVNIQRLVDAIDSFAGTSNGYQQMLQRAVETPCSRDEARAWIVGIEGRNMNSMTNGLLQKSARMVELFESGKGNQGENRLDCYSAHTDFHSNESSNRQARGAQFLTSEFGASASAKQAMSANFEKDWESNVSRGTSLLGESKELATA